MNKQERLLELKKAKKEHKLAKGTPGFERDHKAIVESLLNNPTPKWGHSLKLNGVQVGY